jgi:predicted nucleic acid-binding protein
MKKKMRLCCTIQCSHRDEAVARLAGAYLNEYAPKHRLDLGDVLIAATAKLAEAELYTRNVRHYPMSDIVVKVPYERGK